jgi:hypothetical protein
MRRTLIAAITALATGSVAYADDPVPQVDPNPEPSSRRGSGPADPTMLSERAKKEIQQFFLNATLFTDKDARVTGWRDHGAAEEFIRAKAVGKPVT